jgi:hypothetical protein
MRALSTIPRWAGTNPWRLCRFTRPWNTRFSRGVTSNSVDSIGDSIGAHQIWGRNRLTRSISFVAVSPFSKFGGTNHASSSRNSPASGPCSGRSRYVHADLSCGVGVGEEKLERDGYVRGDDGNGRRHLDAPRLQPPRDHRGSGNSLFGELSRIPAVAHHHHVGSGERPQYPAFGDDNPIQACRMDGKEEQVRGRLRRVQNEWHRYRQLGQSGTQGKGQDLRVRHGRRSVVSGNNFGPFLN